ncbi:MAG: citryl-CoA lyase [Nitrospirae bacterium]|jgi:citryl-CoA lyase|nr:citryl-CoA lyase [Nitrospirota bacterium]
MSDSNEGASTRNWRTSVGGHIDGKAVVRGYPLDDLVGNVTFAEAIYLVLKGELPTERERKIMEAMLVACIDHGIGPPSVVSARTVFSGGNPLNAAVAAGVLTLGDHHGGAIEQCAKVYQEQLTDDVTDVKAHARKVVNEFAQKKKRFPGYGHKLYKRDPRTLRLLDLAKEYGFANRFVEFAVAIQDCLEADSGRPLPLNVDGMIAAVISEMGISWKNGKGIFIIGRIPGLVAHVVEEWNREKPFRRLEEGSYDYDGKPLRAVPEKKK